MQELDEKSRILLAFCREQLHHTARRPLVVGLQAPQGAGKTTLVQRVLKDLPEHGLRGAAVSVDDFYLTRTEQIALAERHPGNPYLEHRGYPGTHDIALGDTTLRALRDLDDERQPLLVPVYDKSAHGGRGDRAPIAAWRTVRGPLDLVIVEGWMLGFSPVDASQVSDSFLVAPNRALAGYDSWYRMIDVFVILRALDWRYVLSWRVEAEEKMKAAGKPGLSREAIEDYVRRFLPAYDLYAGHVDRWPASRTLTLTLDINRRLVPAT